MNTESLKEAKETINDLFERGYSPSEIKDYLGDDKFLDLSFISKDVAEVVYEILSENRVYSAQVSLYDSDDNEIETKIISGCNEKEINKTIEELVAESKFGAVTHGKISKFLPLE